ncbi:MAG: hypothetical protein WCG99_03570 [Candidatus Berkelbacteria bacterium]
MPLTKEDLNEIKKIVSSTEKRLETTIDRKIDGLREELSDKIEHSKQQVLTVLGEEISDLADINSAVITRTDEIDHRLRIVERKLGLVVK